MLWLHACRLEDHALKAGRAGSIPDATTNYPSATQPLRGFLAETGDAVAHLNTIVVGLDAVEKGHQKPKGLNISWAPKDQKTAAMKARRFAVEATLEKSSEALKEYIHLVEKFQKLDDVRKKEKWNGSTSSTEKISDISRFLLGEDDFLHVGGCLLVHWRNRIVHKRSNAELTAVQKKLLLNNIATIKSDFSGLDIKKLLDDFYKGRPTLKDVSSMISFSIRLVRKLDKELGELSKSDLNQLLDLYGLAEGIKKVERETPPQKISESVTRLLQTRAPGLVKSYQKYYGS